MLSDLSDDLRNTNFVWQVVAVLLCWGLGWYLARLLTKLFTKKELDQSKAEKLRVDRFFHALQLMLTLGLIFIARAVLGRWQPVHLLTVLIPLIGSLALIRLGFYIFRRTFVRDGEIGTFLAVFEKLFAGLVWLGLILHFTGLWQDLFDLLDDTKLPLAHNKVSLLTILQAIASVLVTMIAALWASAALETKLMQLPNMHMSLRVVLSRTGRAVLILVAILVSLTLVGIDLTVLSVFGGALGVGLGFGLQKITSSYVSGFIILLDRSMSIGDIITVDKYNGKVTQINTRYTVLKGLDGGESVIPNEMLVSNPVQNYSLSDRSVWVSTDLVVAYNTDVEALLPLLVETATTIARVSKESSPSAYLVKFGADGLELRLGFWISDPENGRTGVISDVNRAVWKLLQERKVELPYAQRVVTLINNAPDKVSDQK
ncbi:mechanosensitive ion channel protein [Undibacterium terreum]|uniref:Mechanosensitive ion channel protein n=1 Tax=Undibacterium terreum TaxID=1224302 RepID=A0A916UGV4_9BURK|nr:mechanosensitive ion channel protein [Undibacterium terreum]